jgi:hypothetical protein
MSSGDCGCVNCAYASIFEHVFTSNAIVA